MKAKKFLPALFLAAMLTTSIYAEENPVGLPDNEPDYICKPLERRPVGDKGHYYVKYSRYTKDGYECGYGYIVEDESGKDLYTLICSPGEGNSLWVINDKAEIYGIHYDGDINHNYDDAYAFMNDDLKVFGGINCEFSGNYPTCVDFEDFCLPLATHNDPMKDGVFYDPDGNVIDDIGAYLKEHGKKLSDGKYFSKKANNRGARDIRTLGETPTPKEFVFSMRNYRAIVGSGTGETWVEDQYGTDLTDIIDGEISVLHYGCDVYIIKYKNGETELMTADFKPFGKGIYDVNVLDFDGAYLIAESKNGASPYDTENTVYYDTEGNSVPTDKIKEKTGKELEDGVVSLDNEPVLDPRGRTEHYTKFIPEEQRFIFKEKQYPRRKIEGSEYYIAGDRKDKDVGEWLEKEDGTDVSLATAAIDCVCGEHNVFRVLSEVDGEYFYSGYQDGIVWFGRREKYFYCLHCGDVHILASSTEDVSPFDTEHVSYFMTDDTDKKIDDINAYLAKQGLKLTDFTAVSETETHDAPITGENPALNKEESTNNNSLEVFSPPEHIFTKPQLMSMGACGMILAGVFVKNIIKGKNEHKR